VKLSRQADVFITCTSFSRCLFQLISMETQRCTLDALYRAMTLATAVEHCFIVPCSVESKLFDDDRP
jgi:hypothetical protein